MQGIFIRKVFTGYTKDYNSRRSDNGFDSSDGHDVRRVTY